MEVYNQWFPEHPLLHRVVVFLEVVPHFTLVSYEFFRKCLFWIIFKLTAGALSAFGLPYLALPFQTAVSTARTLSPPANTVSALVHGSGHTSYYAFDDAFGFIFSYNSIFDYFFSTILLTCYQYGWCDPTSVTSRILSYVGTTSAYATFSRWVDTVFFSLLFLLVLSNAIGHLSRLPTKLFRKYFPRRDRTPRHRVEGLERLVSSVLTLARTIEFGAAITSSSSTRPLASRVARATIRELAFSTFRPFLEPLSWLVGSTRILLLMWSWPARCVASLLNLVLSILLYVPSLFTHYWWPEKQRRVLLYQFTDLDFTSRSSLVASVVPHVRQADHFGAMPLYAAILQAATGKPWPDRLLFRSLKRNLPQMNSSQKFFSAFLSWQIPPDDLADIIADQTAHAKAMVTQATTYSDVRDVLRVLDTLPYVSFDFAVVYRFLTTEGALSHPTVLAILDPVFAKHSSYFPFFRTLDAQWWILGASLPGRPRQMPRSRACIRPPSGHHQGSHHPRTNQATKRDNSSVSRPRASHHEAAAVLANDTAPGSGPFSYYSPVVVAPQLFQTTAYWDQGSRISFISNDLATSLGLPIVSTGELLQLQIFGAGPIRTVKRTVQLEFSIPGLDTIFDFEFVVYDSHIAPLLLGRDFWMAYDVLSQPCKRFEIAGVAIPTLDDLVSALVFEPDQAPYLDPPSPVAPEFTTLVNRFKQAPVVPSLPPSRPDDYVIRIKSGARRRANRPIPRYSDAAATFLKTEVERLFAAGLIERSTERDFAIAQLVPKKTGSFRIVFDYRPVNEITEPMPTSLASFRSLMPGLSHASVFTSLDLQSGYHQLRIADESKPFTAFNTPFGKFQWRVLPFGLCDAPQVFGSYMTELLRDHSAYCRVYLDDILIFSSDPESHLRHVSAILLLLETHQHVVNWDKCTFHVPSIEWVGHQISSAGIAPTDTTRGQIQALGVPLDKTGVKTFLGHVGYLQDLIPNFAHRSAPLTALLTKNAHFDWSTRCQLAFEDLKDAILKAVPLQSFDPLLPIQVHTDASQFAAAAVLLQPSRQDPSKWHPVEYRSKKFDIHQRNWDIHVKEFWAVKFACQKFRFYIEGHFFTLYTDQKSISQIFDQYNSLSKSTEPIDPRLQRWMLNILHYNFQLYFHAGELNVLADHLSRNPSLDHQRVVPVGAVMTLAADSAWADDFKGNYPGDATFGPVYTLLSENGLKESADYPNYKLSLDTGLLYVLDRLCIPHSSLPDFLYQSHIAPSAGHPGARRWLQTLRPLYYFPDMANTVENFVKSCHECQTVKYNSHKAAGLLQAPDRPAGRWTDIATDLITGFPKVVYRGQEVDAILTIVDKFTNRVHFYAVLQEFKTQDLIDLLLQQFFPLHGLPTTIQSDRGPQFTSASFQSLLKLLRVESKLSLARHQQSNGRVENRNKLIETYLRLYVASRDDWPTFLPVGEFALNSQPSTSLGNRSPFEIDIGYNPVSPASFLFPVPDSTNRSSADITELLGRLHTTAVAAHQAAFLNAKEYFDAHHVERQYSAGQEVYLDLTQLGRHLDAHNSQLLPKLRTKFAGPFEIDAVISPVNYQLVMPPSFTGHPVFHISHLRLKHDIPDSYFTAPHDEIPHKRHADGSESVTITEIMGHRKIATGYRLLVRCLPSAEYPLGQVIEQRASDLAVSAPALTLAYAQQHSLEKILKFFPSTNHIETGGDVRDPLSQPSESSP